MWWGIQVVLRKWLAVVPPDLWDPRNLGGMCSMLPKMETFDRMRTFLLPPLSFSGPLQ